MTEQKANELFQKWVKILQLESWNIRFQWCVRERDMRARDSLGCVDFIHENRQAIVQMLDPVDFESKLFNYGYEKTLVHELLHLKFSDIDDSGDPLRDKMTHQLIDDLSRAFVASARG